MDINELRKPKIWNMAIFDIVSVAIFVFLIHNYIWFHPLERVDNRNIFQYIAMFLILYITFIGIGMLFHWTFGIKSGLFGHLGINKFGIIRNTGF
jgi:hypothetical protein